MRRLFLTTFSGLGPGLLLVQPALAAEAAHGPVTTSTVQIVPFIGLLLSLALLQAAAPDLWHRHERKIVAAWSLMTLLLLALTNSWTRVGETLITTALDEYLPFIALVATLYIVAGGIRLTGYLHGSPLTNLGLIALGSVLASFIGTTGAAMVMIQPLVRANADRVHTAHVFVFFIFAVANIGGALTPLGDPPLLIGFLNGVSFFWTTTHLLAPTTFVLLVLALIFVTLDRYFYHVDRAYKKTLLPAAEREGLAIAGWLNVCLMVVVVAAVPLIGLWSSPIRIAIGPAAIALPDLVRTLLLIAVATISLLTTPGADRRENAFAWRPIIEVATVFAGIFITLTPVIAILRDGAHGFFAPLVHLMTRDDGTLSPPMYFWIAGGLSGLLDNAPTYLAFFNLAGGDAKHLMSADAEVLTALSCGCVFMGALTYVGNAPNMMVKSIVIARGMPMPGFLGYLGWSIAILIPVFGATTLLFFR
jgi:Na+/H+ antiporter NhaD/arsenite permease-like protein